MTTDPARVRTKEDIMTDENTTPEPDPIDESAFEIDEEAGTVATTVGSLGNPGSVDDDPEDVEESSVATEVGTLGWPEGAENEEGTGPE
jgi:hypothetical protein